MGLMGVPEDYKDEVAIATFKVSEKGIKITSKMLYTLMYNIIKSFQERKYTTNEIETLQSNNHELTMEELSANAKGRKLENIEIDSADLKNIKKELNNYAVDFSIMKDNVTDTVHVFFKGQDRDRINLALTKCLQAAFKEERIGDLPEQMQNDIKNGNFDKIMNSAKMPIKEQLDRAQKKADVINKSNEQVRSPKKTQDLEI